MAAADNVFEVRNPRLYKRLLDVAANVARRRAVKRQVTTLRADDDVVAREALFGQLVQGFPDRTFASLETIVGGGVDDVCAELDRARS